MCVRSTGVEQASLLVQLLDLFTSVGSSLPLPLEACVAEAGQVISPLACTVVAQGQGDAAMSSPERWHLDFKPAPDPSGTIARVHEGLCSAYTATAATEGLAHIRGGCCVP